MPASNNFEPHCKCGGLLVQYALFWECKKCGARYEEVGKHCPRLVCVDDDVVEDKVNTSVGDLASWKVKKSRKTVGG